MIRLATGPDVDAVSECVAASYQMYVSRIGKKPAPMLDDYSALIEAGSVWVLPMDQTIAGLIVLWPLEGHLYVDNIAVRPERQGEGIGSQLLDHADTLARQQNLSEIRLYTNEAMTENVSYYPKRGFFETHRAEQNGYQRIFYRRTVPA